MPNPHTFTGDPNNYITYGHGINSWDRVDQECPRVHKSAEGIQEQLFLHHKNSCSYIIKIAVLVP